MPRLVRSPLAALPPVALGGHPIPERAPADAVPPVRPDASYLVTGGLGGLGYSVAAWLASLGASHLILLTRPGELTPRQLTQLAQLRTTPCRITGAHADVADRQALAAVLAEVPADLPLRGVLHLAAVLDDAPLEQLNAERLWTVLRPKVLGALYLHELTQGLPLDFFVLYSSAAALLGTAGQANYAAANAYLDALAHHRRAHQLPATSVNWGAFAEVGLAAAQKVRGQRLQHRGLAGMSAAEGIAVLQKVLGHPVAQVAALRFSPQRWVQAHPQLAGWPFLSELLPASASSASSEKGAARPLLIQLLAGLDADRRRQRIREEVQALVAAVIRTQATHINPSTPLRDLGIDSLMAVELRNRLESATALRLKSTLVFSYPTVQALADHLAEALSPPPPAPALPDLNELSDSELEAEALKRLGDDSDTQGS